MKSTASPIAVVCYGEILWDLLPTGAVPGGAPMNVAYHLKKLGHEPGIITRIGTDDNGQKLTDLLRQLKIYDHCVQLDDHQPTGIVHAKPNEHHEMTYDIVAPAAWDFIEYNGMAGELVTNAEYLVFGSLICRNATSRETLLQLLDNARHKVFDVNLRPPFVDQSIIEQLLDKADIVKMNDSELEMISGWYGEHPSAKQQIEFLMSKFNIRTCIVTRGAKGAMLNTGGTLYEHAGYKVQVQDTVGSGDSFLAATISGMIHQNDPSSILDFACAVGGLVTSKKGGWPQYATEEIDAIRKSK